MARATGSDGAGMGFACRPCHRLTNFQHGHRNHWNEMVSYLSWGLLYGSEVEQPPSWAPVKKRTVKKRGMSEKTRQRHAALAQRLMEGWTYGQIAVELGISLNTAMARIARLYAEHGAHGRRELAQKLEMTLKGAARKPGDTVPTLQRSVG